MGHGILAARHEAVLEAMFVAFNGDITRYLSACDRTPASAPRISGPDFNSLETTQTAR